MEAPVFYDPSGRRGRVSKRVLLGLILLIVLAAVAFGLTILNVPAPDPLKLGIERQQPRSLNAQVAHIRRVVVRPVHRVESWMPGQKRGAAPATGRQTVVGFYVPWTESSRASLSRHIGQMDWVAPVISFVTGPNHDFSYQPDKALRAVLATSQHHPLILPVVQNVHNDQWDGPNTAKLLKDPKARAKLLDQIGAMLTAERAAGVVFDFEELPDAAQPDYRRFIDEANKRFTNQLVTLAVPVDNDAWDLKAYARVADKLFLMTYDEHYIGGDAGPIASQPWFVQRVRQTIKAVGRDKAIVAIGNYAYDWPDGSTNADELSNEDAWLIAHDNKSVTTLRSRQRQCPFDYHDDDGTLRHVWMLDAASSWNQLRAIKAAAPSASRCGGWAARIPARGTISRDPQTAIAARLRPAPRSATSMSRAMARSCASPRAGHRHAHRHRRRRRADPRRTLSSYPTPYLVRRTGYKPKQIALTFDDGPIPAGRRASSTS
jgi:hypothetical protein